MTIAECSIILFDTAARNSLIELVIDMLNEWIRNQV